MGTVWRRHGSLPQAKGCGAANEAETYMKILTEEDLRCGAEGWVCKAHGGVLGGWMRVGPWGGMGMAALGPAS